ncbi:MAG: hypothetical protein C0412_22300 [Flavobacterium sp.]|nr:hypothetical protein [Flavobacterium sp.]
MKNLIIIVLSLFISNIVFSQEISKEKIYGTWKVQKNRTPKSDPKFNDIIDGFNEATFTFYENGNFVLKSTNTSKLFLMTLNMLKNAKWKLDQNKQIIRLGNEENYFSIMGIVVKERDSKTFFLINESPIELEMVNN